MRFLGCFGILLVIAIMAGEAYSFVFASHLLTTHARDLIGTSWVDTVLPLILLQVVLMVIGVLQVKGAVNRLPTALMGTMMGQNADAGKLMVQALGGILLIVPGFFLDVVGILLLLPPVQAVLARLGTRIAMSIVRQQMAKMFPGGMPGGAGFPGGMAGGTFAGFPGGGFPGMQPRGAMTPDERIPRKPGRVIETTAERVDK